MPVSDQKILSQDFERLTNKIYLKVILENLKPEKRKSFLDLVSENNFDAADEMAANLIPDLAEKVEAEVKKTLANAVGK